MTKQSAFGLLFIGTLLVTIVAISLNYYPEITSDCVHFITTIPSRFGFGLLVIVVVYWLYKLSDKLENKSKQPKQSEPWPKKKN